MKHNSLWTRIFRILLLLMHLLLAVAIVLAVFPWLREGARERAEQRWHMGLLWILNVKLSLRGTVPDLTVRHMFVVANHISWLDVYMLNAARPVRFVSKAEVLSWPVVGWLARKTGTLFIDRNKRHDTARVNHEISSVLDKGGCIAVFPEGTTSDGTMLRPFYASLLQPAVHGKCKIWPVAIRYCHADGTLNKAPAYIDEMTFGDSFWRILCQPEIYAELVFNQPIIPHGKTRRELASLAGMQIAEILNLHVEPKEVISSQQASPRLDATAV